MRVDPDQLDAVRLGERERLRSERGHHLAPDGHGGARPGQARRAVVVVADPHDAEPVARESGKPGVALLVGGAGLSGDRELGRQEILQPLRRALAHDVLHGRGQEVHRLGRECLLDRERIALQRPAFLRGDFADRAQRGAPAAARDRLVHLRDLEGTQVRRAEQGRGERLHLALDAEPAHVGEHALDAELGAQARRGDVVGLRQRHPQRYRAVELPVVIRRLPVRSAAAFPDEGAVVDRREQRIARRLAQRGEIDGGLEQRSHRARGVDRAVVALVAHIASADQRLHLAALGVGDHDRPFEPGLAEAVLLVELGQAPNQGAFGRALHARVQRGEDAQALRAQIGLVVVAAHLTVHEPQEGRVGRGAHRRLASHPQLRGARGRVLLQRDRAVLPRLAQDEIAALERALWMAVGVVVRRALYQADQQRGLCKREVLHFLAEIELRGQPDAVDGAVAVLAEIDLVEVRFEDFGLVVVQLQQHRHDELGELALQGALRSQEEVLDELLGERAAALDLV